MAYAAVIDLCFHLHSFRNVDLFHQGLYRFRVRAYQDVSEAPGGRPLLPATTAVTPGAMPPPECVAAVPYSILPFPTNKGGERGGDLLSSSSPSHKSKNTSEATHKVDYHQVAPGDIDSDTQTFFSRSFLVRYCDEEVVLDEACCFRLEIDLCQPGATTAPIYVEFDLMFSDPGVNDKKSNYNEKSDSETKVPTQDTDTKKVDDNTQLFASALKDLPATNSPLPVATMPPTEPKYVSVSYQIYRLNDVFTQGLCEFVPIIFDEFHYSVCMATFHAVLLDIRSRIRLSPSPCPYFPRHRHKRPAPTLNYGKKGTEESRPTEYIPLSTPRVPRTFSSIIPPLRTVEDFLQEASNSLAPNNSEKSLVQHADFIHQYCIRHLLYSLLRLSILHRTLVRRCLVESDRNSDIFLQGGLIECGTLRLPGENNEIRLSDPLVIETSDYRSKSLSFLVNLRIQEPDLPNNKASEKIVTIRLPTLSCRVKEHDTLTELQAVSKILSDDFFCLGGQLSEIWGQLCLLLPLLGSRAEPIFRVRSETNTLLRWRQFIVYGDRIPAIKMVCPPESIGETHLKQADQIRRIMLQSRKNIPIAPVTDLFLPAGPEVQPIIFQQRYGDRSAPVYVSDIECQVKTLVGYPKPYEGLHLFVLVHGFQGNSYDMRLMQNTISLRCPGAVCLCSSANEDSTEGRIDEMGDRLADEIDRFITDWCGDATIGRVSFICHSLGGIIARAAFPKLIHLWSKFHLFLTLSSPHLGYTCSTNRLVDAGMWVLKRWKKSDCLQQLTFSDAKQPKDSFMYKLAAEKSAALAHFNHLVLLSSYQDQYVPYESARIEISTKVENENKLGYIYGDMARAMLKNVRPEAFTRLDIQFKISEKSLDTLIGRAAHIQFLENQLLMRMLTLAWPEFFT